MFERHRKHESKLLVQTKLYIFFKNILSYTILSPCFPFSVQSRNFYIDIDLFKCRSFVLDRINSLRAP